MTDFFPVLDWTDFVYFAIPSIVLLAISAASALMSKRGLAVITGVAAVVIFAFFIGGMWHSLQRPPLRTMGETRLWYAFFVIIAGLIVFVRWRYKWILAFSGLLSTVFMIINIAKPEIHNKTMMPALESPFFVPHVISYIFAYAMLAAALIMSIYIIYNKHKNSNIEADKMIYISDNLVYTGISFLMIGLLLGAVWAKIAWGTYWGWDPKETWAAITMISYLLYIHHRIYRPKRFEISFILLIISFLFLQICWYGVNYLPSAQNSSIHTYGM